jgi:exopolyphosphatase / guanosine-5'-triphosphate,3'-diphosphate pyrophosphatase
VHSIDPRGPDHLLGTSGTVTTIAGVHLGLRHYDRSLVDGTWLENEEAERVVNRLLSMGYEQRTQNGCIGRERADLVLAGCAIMEEIRQAFPAKRIRVADRGLREGILASLMRADGHLSRRT